MGVTIVVAVECPERLASRIIESAAYRGATMQTETISRHQVVELVMKMPPDKLAAWYEYGLFIQSRPLVKTVGSQKTQDLMAELAEWEAASDEDWQAFESLLAEMS
jgi:hypothetical protein